MCKTYFKYLTIVVLLVFCQAGAGAQSFRVLVVASKARDHQKMIAAARPFFEKMALDESFQLDFSDDTSQINPVNLARYQVFVMLQLAPFDMSYAQQDALQQFVEKGNGFVGLHAGGLTGHQFHPNDKYWQWFEDLMGNVIYSPHPAYQHATMVVEDQSHPVTRHLPARIDIPDEWYEWDKSVRSNPDVRVLASVDESTYHQNKPMGDHPVIWTNQRFRRMIYISPGHSPELLEDPAYATLLRDAIRWAASTGPAGASLPVSNRRVGYAHTYTPGAPVVPQSELFLRLKQALTQSHLTITYADSATGIITGKGWLDLPVNDSGHRYQLMYDYNIGVTDGRYTFRTDHYYEKPINIGTTSEFTKIEYRWWDFQQGKPWHRDDKRLFLGLDSAMTVVMDSIYQRVNHPRFRALVLYENGGWHVRYSWRARNWLAQQAVDSNFAIDYLTHSDSINDELLSKYRLVIQLDFVPYGWKPGAQAAFKRYIEEGRGGWVGFHHATLLGEFDNTQMWPWFSDFMGGIRWKSYIARFAKATVRIEDHQHPVFAGLPDSFVVQKEEWYTYDKSPRPNVHVLGTVDENTYSPDTTIKMGDHPVIWSNEKMKARNVYIFMGHDPVLFDDTTYRHLFANAISWAAQTPTFPLSAVAASAAPAVTLADAPGAPSAAPTHAGAPAKAATAPGTPSAAPTHAGASAATKAQSANIHPRYQILAFYSNRVEQDHIDFAYDAIRFYSNLAKQKNFAFDTTSNWENCNERLKEYQVVLWLNDFPHAEAQRTAFQNYMDGGGAWLGFHVSGYNDRTTHWPWFVHFFGDAVFYNNSWPPLPAKLIVDDNKHPATHRLPARYTAPINEWYGWQPNPRNNKEVKVLITLDPANYPLGKKDTIRGGDIPVCWTNTRYKMLYMNMGHGDKNLTSPVQNHLFEDALEWLASLHPRPAAHQASSNHPPPPSPAGSNIRRVHHHALHHPPPSISAVSITTRPITRSLQYPPSSTRPCS
jgi:type 1 glutamine amidotransferase